MSSAPTEDLDEGRFSVVVGPNVGAMEGGRSLGRFAEALGPVGTKAYREIARAHETAAFASNAWNSATCRGNRS